MSTQAKAARQLKKELQNAFPSVKFSVTSDSFAGGDAVRVSYTDGPTTEQVKQYADKYQYGSFDGMRDLYEMTNTRDDIPQVKYVTVDRSKSDEVREAIREMICTDYGIDEIADDNAFIERLGNASINQRIHRKFYRMDFTADDEQLSEQYEAAL